MPTINPTLPSDGDDAVVAPYNSAIEAILAVINGGIDEDNLAAGAVILSKLSSAVQQALVPAGTLLAYGGAAAPSGFLLCYGQAVSRSTYSDLYAIIGTSYGVGNGSSTFNLPDLRGRIPVGADAMGGTAANIAQRSTTISTTNTSPTATVASATGLLIGQYVVSTNVPAGTTILAISGTTLTLSANATATASGVAARFSQFGNDAQVLGATGGTSSHILVTAQLAAHTHGYATDRGGVGYAGGANNAKDSSIGATGSTTGSTGSDQPHPNMQPGQIFNYIIKI